MIKEEAAVIEAQCSAEQAYAALQAAKDALFLANRRRALVEAFEDLAGVIVIESLVRSQQLNALIVQLRELSFQ